SKGGDNGRYKEKERRNSILARDLGVHVMGLVPCSPGSPFLHRHGVFRHRKHSGSDAEKGVLSGNLQALRQQVLTAIGRAGSSNGFRSALVIMSQSQKPCVTELQRGREEKQYTSSYNDPGNQDASLCSG